MYLSIVLLDGCSAVLVRLPPGTDGRVNCTPVPALASLDPTAIVSLAWAAALLAPTLPCALRAKERAIGIGNRQLLPLRALLGPQPHLLGT